MYACRRHLVSRQQPCLRIRIEAVPISAVLFAFVLSPACIGVLQVALILVPILKKLNFLDLLVLLAGVPQNRHLNEEATTIFSTFIMMPSKSS